MSLKARELSARMTLEEKSAYVSGCGFWFTKAIPRLGVPAFQLTDGPHGLRAQKDAELGTDYTKTIPATAFPTASLSACSFDPLLLEEMGVALARECIKQGVSVLLGPGANIKRSPLCGRNFEYFSEDPLLSSAMATAWIKGVESRGVGASLKHFAANNQEKRRMIIDAVIEERALREIYLASFEDAVMEGRPSTVMCAYNRINGQSCSESILLTQGILRDEWRFPGFVMTDWGASNDRILGLEAGIDLEMPEAGPSNAGLVAQAVRDGSLSADLLDESVERILDFAIRDRPQPGPADSWSEAGHHELARRIARESMVLLKNEGDLLPLSPGAPVGLIGELARSPRYQGAGSSLLLPTRLEALKDALEARKQSFDFAAGYPIDSDEAVEGLEAEALEVARRTAKAGGILVFVLGLTASYESEGFDRGHLRLPGNQTRLLSKISQLCPDIVAVYVGGSPVETPWMGEVRSLLAAYLGGQASGPAICDLLFGDFSPSGKLAETWPLRLEDSPSHGNFPGEDGSVLYKEGLFVGYRWHAGPGRPVRFPFGFGLSYTRFLYSKLLLSSPSIEAGGTLLLSFELQNSGRMRGSEVVQVYLSFPESRIERPPLSLAAFVKVELGAGESRRVELRVGPRALRYWDRELRAFAIEDGPVLARIGGGSGDLPLEARFGIVKGTRPSIERKRAELLGHPSEMSDAEFEERLGFAIPPVKAARPFGLDSLPSEMAPHSLVAALFHRALVARYTKSAGVPKGSANYRMFEEMIGEMPLRKIMGMSGGRLGTGLLEGICALANGRKVRGILLILGIARVG